MSLNNQTHLVLFGQLEKYEQAANVIRSGFQIDPYRYRLNSISITISYFKDFQTPNDLFHVSSSALLFKT